MKIQYSVDKALKQKTAKKKKQSEDRNIMQEEIDQNILEAAEQMEAENYKKAKAGRLKLEYAADLQKHTTDEMRSQGEKIVHAKASALNVHKGASNADKLAETIEKESHLFNFGIPFWGGIKRWWNKNRVEENDIESMQQSMEATDAEAKEGMEGYGSNENEAHSGEQEYIPGQHKTDAELRKILQTVKGINKEASIQSQMAEKQKTDLQDINKINEYSKKKVDKVDFKLKKGM